MVLIHVNQLNDEEVASRLHIFEGEPDVSLREIEATFHSLPLRHLARRFVDNLNYSSSYTSIVIVRVLVRNSLVFLEAGDVDLSVRRHFKSDTGVTGVRMLAPYTRMKVVFVDMAGLDISEIVFEISPAHEESTIIFICPFTLAFEFRSPLFRGISPGTSPFELAPRIT